jgi:hypothetical protein
LLPVQPQNDRIFAIFSSSKGDRQPKPNEYDRFLAIQPKIDTHLSHLIQSKSIISPNSFSVGLMLEDPTKNESHLRCMQWLDLVDMAKYFYNVGINTYLWAKKL